MSAKILDGKILSDEIKDSVRAKAASLKKNGIIPGLAVILVGNDPASEIYVRNKGRGCEETGILSRTIRLDAGISQEELEDEIEKLNLDHGFRDRWNCFRGYCQVRRGTGIVIHAKKRYIDPLVENEGRVTEIRSDFRAAVDTFLAESQDVPVSGLSHAAVL